MTERKSTEIKIRVTPSFKARVQSAADAAGVSLTEWLETASEEKVLSLPAPMPPRGWDYQPKPGLIAVQEFISVYEGQTPPERRTEPCPHSKPPYAFCAECDR